MATGRLSSLLDVEIPSPVGINNNLLLKPVKEPVNRFTCLALALLNGQQVVRDIPSQ